MIQFGANFSTLGVPETGLSPTINIRDTSDGSLVVNGAAMAEVGDGAYKYNFTNDTAKKYSAVIDGGIDTLDSRYLTAWSERAKAEAEIVLILEDTNELQGNQGNWLTAIGFATENPPSQNLADYKATGFSTHDAAAIKTVMEAAGTKLTLVKTATDKMHFSGNNVQARVADKGALNNPPSENIGDYKADVSAIPTNPLLTNDARLDNLDAAISSRANQNPPSQVLNDYKADVTNLDVAVSTRSSHGDPTAGIKGAPGKTNQQVFDNEKGTDGAYTGTPPTVVQIKTELEGVGTKLTEVKNQTDKLHYSGNNVDAKITDKGVLNNPPSENIADYKDKNTEDEIKTAIHNYAHKDTYKANVSAIPTNPLLTDDARLNNLADIAWLLKIVKNKKELKKTGTVWELLIYNDAGDTPILNKAIKDKDGNNITDLEAGTLAAELKTSV